MFASSPPPTPTFPALADAGKFRRDLLDRLAFDVITLPPLRERGDDLLLLADYFAINMATELGREYFPGFSDAAIRQMTAHDWPGNLRELKNVVERAVYRSDADAKVKEIVLDPFDSPYRPRNEPEAPNTSAPPILPLDLKQAVRDFETERVEAAMDQARHNQRKAAELLGLTYHQFRGYLKKYGLQPGRDEI